MPSQLYEPVAYIINVSNTTFIKYNALKVNMEAFRVDCSLSYRYVSPFPNILKKSSPAVRYSS